jgi:hypothetical protein
MNNPAISTTVDNDPPPSSRTSRTIPLTPAFSIGLLMIFTASLPSLFSKSMF